MKILKQNYHTHLLAGILVGHLLLTTYKGVQFGAQLFFTTLFSLIVGVAWEGICIIAKRTQKFDKVDCGLVVAGGLSTFLLPENIRAYCVYAFAVFAFIYFVKLCLKSK